MKDKLLENLIEIIRSENIFHHFTIHIFYSLTQKKNVEIFLQLKLQILLGQPGGVLEAHRTILQVFFIGLSLV